MERGEAEKREELSDEEFVAGLGITPPTEEEKSLVEDVHDILSGAGYIFDAADLLDALVYVFEGDIKNAALSSLAAVPIVGSGIKAVKVLKNAAEVAGVLVGAKKLADAAFEGRKAAKAAKAAEEAAGSSKAGVKTITEGAGEKINVGLQYKECWTAEQKTAADAKLKALSEANTVKTPVNRSGTSARTIYKRAYGNNSIPQGFDIDHKIDLQLGGSDKLENLWPLDRSVNRSLGKQINNYIKNYPIGTIFGEFSIK